MNHHLRNCFNCNLIVGTPRRERKRKEEKGDNPLSAHQSLPSSIVGEEVTVNSLTFPNRDIETRLDRFYSVVRGVADGKAIIATRLRQTYVSETEYILAELMAQKLVLTLL